MLLARIILISPPSAFYYFLTSLINYWFVIPGVLSDYSLDNIVYLNYVCFLLNSLVSKSALSIIFSDLYFVYPKCSNARANGNNP